MPRVLHIIDSLGRSGTTRQLLLVADGLAQQGFEVHVCSLYDALGSKVTLPFREGPEEGSRSSAGHSFSFTSLGRRWPVDPLANWRLVRLLARLRPDVVHTWDSVAGALLAAGLTKGPRLIVGKYRIPRYPSDWDTFWERRLAPHVERLVTNSPHARDGYARRGLPSERFAVIPPGVPPALASDATSEELLAELGLPTDARLIGVVGRLVPDKRVQDLIWAADLLRVLHDNLRLLIIGDGPERRQLERYARLASDLVHIQFLGERPDIWRIMPHLDVLWNGSENRGLSIAILEAMAAGVPVIASDTPCNRELVVEGETGFLIPLGQRSGRAARARWTDRIFTDREFAARLAAASHRRVTEHFSAEQMIAAHAKIYEPWRD